MNPDEYKRWKEAMRNQLIFVFSREEVEILLEWWDQIDRNQEAELVGNDMVQGMSDMFESVDAIPRHQGRRAIWINWTTRLWLYAPFILMRSEPVPQKTWNLFEVIESSESHVEQTQNPQEEEED